MGRFALTWLVEDRPHLIELDPNRDYVIGRDPGADVVLPQQTVSRKHAVLRGEGSRFLIEARSSTNPTMINGAPLAGSLPLSDGAEVDAGGQRLTFWDLAAGDQISGPVCSHCGRENTSADADCWFCGTSLVNAPTGIRTRRQVLCRLIGPDERAIDLIDQQALMFRSDGTPEPVPANASSTDPSVAILAGRPILRGSSVTIEGRPERSTNAAGEAPGDGDQSRTLSTGDRIRIGERRFVVIVR